MAQPTLKVIPLGDRSLRIEGRGFDGTPGQHAFIFMGFPDDLCVDPKNGPCHGIYTQAVIQEDGTFAGEHSGIAVQPGTGQVAACQYDPAKRQWVWSAVTEYTVES